MKTYYMHTLDRKPASYDGHQVHFMSMGIRAKLCRSLREIRKQQRASTLWRADQGWTDVGQYGYCLVSVP